ncbi:hypothetical protein ILYODFUR_038444 [Ilyodon furcidens]|uniref:Alkylated DNA repair protein AlkB homologue 8 N-terminal domain-containing protein n=1 Tax=Ilyodon furcidens TaxID=33524 RepID=A0ABV0UFY8_9TELE
MFTCKNIKMMGCVCIQPPLSPFAFAAVTAAGVCVYEKGQSRLYFLRKLRSFSISSWMLHIFYSHSGKCDLFCHHLLGKQHQSQGLKKAQQADKEGWLCSGDSSGTSGDHCGKKDSS